MSNRKTILNFSSVAVSARDVEALNGKIEELAAKRTAALALLKMRLRAYFARCRFQDGEYAEMIAQEIPELLQILGKQSYEAAARWLKEEA